MNWLGIGKFVAEAVVSLSVSTVVGTVVKATIKPEMKPIRKLGIVIGSSVLSGMVGSMAWEFSEKKIDGAVAVIFGIKSTVDGIRENLNSETDDGIGEPDLPATDDTKKE